MTSLTVRFNQLVDLAVNPTMGTINTSLLHNLLHIVVHQLQLSSKLIEFHGAGSAAIENQIVNNRHLCGVEITEYEMSAEVDESTGITVERRKEIEESRNLDETTKLFSIRNVNVMEEDVKYPIGYPLNPIQVISIDQLQKHQMPLDVPTTHPERPGSPLKAMFDFNNVTKRLDALEIGIRQLAELMSKIETNTEKDVVVDDPIDVMAEINPKLTSLQSKFDELQKDFQKFTCKCNADDFETKLFEKFQQKLREELEEMLSELRSEMGDLKSFCEDSIGSQREEWTSQKQLMEKFQFKVCEEFTIYKTEVVRSMVEVQEMLDAKLDKIAIPELKNYIRERFEIVEEKIENIDCKKALAAGAAKRLFKNLNCVSCGEDVIQADAWSPARLSIANQKIDGVHTEVIRSKCCLD